MEGFGKEVWGPTFKIFYSNLTFYYNSVMNELQARDIQLGKLAGNFLPYVSEGSKSFSGFYSSRPQFKSLLKHHSSFAHASSTLFAQHVITHFFAHNHQDKAQTLQQISQ
mmetsp:Transcript_23257/g.17676  ORF Transcript_23257/g.17676 Transcript_23257/m.17676 type:complete len:110 (+) Transcript_23257:70-399(+)